MPAEVREVWRTLIPPGVSSTMECHSRHRMLIACSLGMERDRERRANCHHLLYLIVGTPLNGCVLTESFTERFGRKPSLMAGWFLIAMAMVCLTVARSPGVWVRPPQLQP